MHHGRLDSATTASEPERLSPGLLGQLEFRVSGLIRALAAAGTAAARPRLPGQAQ